MSSLTTLLIGMLSMSATFAHPGHSVSEEAMERSAFLKRNPNSVQSCANSLRARGHLENAVARRQGLAREIKARRSLPAKIPLPRRSFSQYNVSHLSDLDITYGSDETLLFDDNSSCLLQPEVTQGPYYVDGELIRSDISEDQTGVPLYLDIQIIDTSDCTPVPAVFMDIWHCNATGVYSGISATGNGNGDASNLDTTFLRGIQATDVNGVAQFETVFPGHYTGRATHIHVLTHNTNTTLVRTNGTLLGSNFTTHASHVGQIFFDQDLISLAEASSPYSSNTQTLTLNADDDILAQEANSMDPFVEYVLLGDNIQDGILAWISLGIDPNSDDEIISAATHYSSGGVSNSNESMGGADANNGPGNSNGTALGSVRPSGSVPPSMASIASPSTTFTSSSANASVLSSSSSSSSSSTVLDAEYAERSSATPSSCQQAN